jgi:hypothetical protein
MAPRSSALIHAARAGFQYGALRQHRGAPIQGADCGSFASRNSGTINPLRCCTMQTATHVLKSPCHAVVFFSPPLVDASLVVLRQSAATDKSTFPTVAWLGKGARCGYKAQSLASEAVDLGISADGLLRRPRPYPGTEPVQTLPEPRSSWPDPRQE